MQSDKLQHTHVRRARRADMNLAVLSKAPECTGSQKYAAAGWVDGNVPAVGVSATELRSCQEMNTFHSFEVQPCKTY
eukprot:3679102-Pleurochrysis_carterae.AAC.1